MAERIPLYGKHVSFDRTDREIRGLVIRSSDCENAVPPQSVHEKHEELNNTIDKRKITDGEQYGWIEHENGTVTDWEIDDDIL